MICPPCQNQDHSNCEDAQHPGRLYDSCSCRHRTPPPPEAMTQPKLGDSVEG